MPRIVPGHVHSLSVGVAIVQQLDRRQHIRSRHKWSRRSAHYVEKVVEHHRAEVLGDLCTRAEMELPATARQDLQLQRVPVVQRSAYRPAIPSYFEGVRVLAQPREPNDAITPVKAKTQ